MPHHQPQIYVASLCDYNNGILHGRWIDLEGQDKETLQAEINAMLAESPTAKQGGAKAEEYAIHDSNDIGAVDEYESLDDVLERADLVLEYGDAFFAAMSNWPTLEEVSDALEEGWTEADSLEDWAEELAYEIGMIAENEPRGSLHHYIDWERVANDWKHDYSVVNYDGGLFVFHSI